VNVEAASLPLGQWLVEFEAVAAHFVFLWVSPVGSPNFRGQRPRLQNRPYHGRLQTSIRIAGFLPAEVWT